MNGLLSRRMAISVIASTSLTLPLTTYAKQGWIEHPNMQYIASTSSRKSRCDVYKSADSQTVIGVVWVGSDLTSFKFNPHTVYLVRSYLKGNARFLDVIPVAFPLRDQEQYFSRLSKNPYQQQSIWSPDPYDRFTGSSVRRYVCLLNDFFSFYLALPLKSSLTHQDYHPLSDQMKKRGFTVTKTLSTGDGRSYFGIDYVEYQDRKKRRLASLRSDHIDAPPGKIISNRLIETMSFNDPINLGLASNFTWIYGALLHTAAKKPYGINDRFFMHGVSELFSNVSISLQSELPSSLSFALAHAFFHCEAGQASNLNPGTQSFKGLLQLSMFRSAVLGLGYMLRKAGTPAIPNKARDALLFAPDGLGDY
jgi:hypothetical protein